MKWFPNTIQLLIENWVIVAAVIVLGYMAAKGSLGKLLDAFVEKTGIFGPVGLFAIAVAAIVIFKYDAVQNFFDPINGPGRAIGASARIDAKSYEYSVYPGQQSFPDPDDAGPAAAVAVTDPTNTQNPVFNAYAMGVKNTYELQAENVQTEIDVENLRQACLKGVNPANPACEAMNRLAEVDAESRGRQVEIAVEPIATKVKEMLDHPVSYSFESNANGTEDGKAGSKAPRPEVNKKTSFSMSLGMAIVLVLGLGAVFGRRRTTWS